MPQLVASRINIRSVLQTVFFFVVDCARFAMLVDAAVYVQLHGQMFISLCRQSYFSLLTAVATAILVDAAEKTQLAGFYSATRCHVVAMDMHPETVFEVI
jgi:hypothetical protein